MIVAHGGIQADVSTERLPADAYPALFAYSLNRQLRKLYAGDFFQFRQGSTIKEYPTDAIDPNQTAYLVRVYDQKAMHGVPVRNLVQLDQSKQPTLTVEGTGSLAVGDRIRIIRSTHPYFGQTGIVTSLSAIGFAVDYTVPKDGVNESDGGANFSAEGVTWEKITHIKAVFDQNEYLDLESQDLAQNIKENFTITSIGDGGDFPRPMIGIWGSTDRITVEPSDQATRFTFNNNLGTILDSDGRVTQCISGFDATQNNNKVLTVKTGIKHGHITRVSQTPSLSSISIGRENNRLYKGNFSEATMHLGELTELGSEQLFKTIREYYGY